MIEEYQITPEACDEVLEYWDTHQHLVQKATVNQEVDTTKKKALEMYITDTPSLSYMEQLGECLNKYLEQWKFADKVYPFGIKEPIKIQYYKPDWGFYEWHMENTGRPVAVHRHLVFMTYLNDVDNGGTEFYYQDKKVEAVKGKTLIWPAAWTHTHRGVVSSKQEKYIITGWYSFD